MGTGIGICCERCTNQLDYEVGFELKEDGNAHDLCKLCASIVRFDKRNDL